MTLTGIGLPGPDSLLPGDPCPRCGRAVRRWTRMFYWRGVFYDGAVCMEHGLWPIRGEEMPPLRPAQQ